MSQLAGCVEAEERSCDQTEGGRILLTFWARVQPRMADAGPKQKGPEDVSCFLKSVFIDEASGVQSGSWCWQVMAGKALEKVQFLE